MSKCISFPYQLKPGSTVKCFTAVGVTVPNGSGNTTVFIKGSHFFHGTTSFSRAQEFAQSRQMASNELLLQMTS